MNKTLEWRNAMLSLVNRLDPVPQGQGPAPLSQQQLQQQQQAGAGWGSGAGWGGSADVAQTLDEVAAVLAELEPLQQLAGMGGEGSGHREASRHGEAPPARRKRHGRCSNSSSEDSGLEEKVEGMEGEQGASSFDGRAPAAAGPAEQVPAGASGRLAGVLAAAAGLEVQGAPVEQRFKELGKPAPTKPAALHRLKVGRISCQEGFMGSGCA